TARWVIAENYSKCEFEQLIRRQYFWLKNSELLAIGCRIHRTAMTLERVRGQHLNGRLLVLGRDVARRVHRWAGRRHVVAHAAFPAQRGPRANSQDRCAARRWPDLRRGRSPRGLFALELR